MLSEIHVINDYNVELRPRMDSRVVLSASIRLTIKGKNGSMPGAFRKNWILLITSMIPCGLRVIFSLGSGHHWPFWKQRSCALLKAFQGPSSSQAVMLNSEETLSPSFPTGMELCLVRTLLQETQCIICLVSGCA